MYRNFNTRPSHEGRHDRDSDKSNGNKFQLTPTYVERLFRSHKEGIAVSISTHIPRMRDDSSHITL